MSQLKKLAKKAMLRNKKNKPMTLAQIVKSGVTFPFMARAVTHGDYFSKDVVALFIEKKPRHYVALVNNTRYDAPDNADKYELIGHL